MDLTPIDFNNRADLLFLQSLAKIGGIKVFKNDTVTEIYIEKQVKFPRSKKKRIRKKWEKHKKNSIKFLGRQIVLIGGAVYVHSLDFDNFIKFIWQK